MMESVRRDAPAEARPAAGPRHEWVAARTARRLWREFRHDSRALPRAAWTAWARTLAAGFVAAAVLTLAITVATRSAEDAWLAAWDRQALLSIVEWAPINFAQSVMIESPGNMFGMLSVTVSACVIAVLARQPLVAATFAVYYPLATGLMWVGWLTWNRARPDLVADGIAAPGLHSFPSGHVVSVTVLYGFLTYLWARASGRLLERALALVLGVTCIAVVSLARLTLGAHWPSDTIAGAIVGLAYLGVLIAALRRGEARL
jgi:undecaprenyl-diphosphatase